MAKTLKSCIANVSSNPMNAFKILFTALLVIIIELAIIGHELSVIIQNTVKL